jgi:hypothetical protein
MRKAMNEQLIWGALAVFGLLTWGFCDIFLIWRFDAPNIVPTAVLSTLLLITMVAYVNLKVAGLQREIRRLKGEQSSD